MLNYTKQELEKLIFEDKLSYREISRINSVSDTYVKKYAKKLGIILPKRACFPERWVPFNKGKTKVKDEDKCVYQILPKKLCKFCQKPNLNKYNVFCSSKCMGDNKKSETRKRYEMAVLNGENISSFEGVSTFKRFVLEEQDNKCAICKIPNNWNNSHLVLVLDHIDGDASNNKRNNLRCICPNCDSQLPTFKSKNKNSARKERYLKNYKT